MRWNQANWEQVIKLVVLTLPVILTWRTLIFKNSPNILKHRQSCEPPLGLSFYAFQHQLAFITGLGGITELYLTPLSVIVLFRHLGFPQPDVEATVLECFPLSMASLGTNYPSLCRHSYPLNIANQFFLEMGCSCL